MPTYEVILRHALTVTLLATLPVVGAVLVVGLAVGVLQALTRLNDATFSMAPRLMVGLALVFVLGGWMLARDANLARSLIGGAATLVDQPWS